MSGSPSSLTSWASSCPTATASSCPGRCALRSPAACVSFLAQNRFVLYKSTFVPWCRDEVQGDTSRVPGYKYFLAVMNECFPRVRWTDKQRFSHCTLCSKLNHLVLLSTGALRRAFSLLKSVHVEEIRNQRFLAVLWEEEAKWFPDRLLWLCNDDMATGRTDFPRSGARLNKDEEGMERVQVKILNYMSTHPPHCTFFVKPQTVPEDTNTHVFCECVLIRKLIGRYEKGTFAWPRCLIIYEDNTASGNKANTRMQWLALLVKMRIFDKIIVVYFTKGAFAFSRGGSAHPLWWQGTPTGAATTCSR